MMKSIVPYTKEIPFTSKIAEICSISLEHELEITDTEISGDFIVSGEYRSHEVSVNKEPFAYKLPFSVDVTDTILKDSIDFEITDFTYEILHDDTLKVDIQFCVTAEEAPVEEERENEEEEIEEVEEEEEAVDGQKEEFLEEIHEMLEDGNIEEYLEEPNDNAKEERLDEESENLILESATDKNSEFVTYHIHIVHDGDTIESICATYQTDVQTLKEYNQVDTLAVGDKIVIPCLDE